MNGDERSLSCRMQETPVATASLLQSDQTCDEDQARLYHESQVTAVNRAEAICRE